MILLDRARAFAVSMFRRQEVKPPVWFRGNKPPPGAAGIELLFHRVASHAPHPIPNIDNSPGALLPHLSPILRSVCDDLSLFSRGWSIAGCWVEGMPDDALLPCVSKFFPKFEPRPRRQIPYLSFYLHWAADRIRFAQTSRVEELTAGIFGAMKKARIPHRDIGFSNYGNDEYSVPVSTRPRKLRKIVDLTVRQLEARI